MKAVEQMHRSPQSPALSLQGQLSRVVGPPLPANALAELRGGGAGGAGGAGAGGAGRGGQGGAGRQGGGAGGRGGGGGGGAGGRGAGGAGGVREAGTTAGGYYDYYDTYYDVTYGGQSGNINSQSSTALPVQSVPIAPILGGNNEAGVGGTTNVGPL